jgi:hypothetical protein
MLVQGRMLLVDAENVAMPKTWCRKHGAGNSQVPEMQKAARNGEPP